jgi:hypothetical protein
LGQNDLKSVISGVSRMVEINLRILISNHLDNELAIWQKIGTLFMKSILDDDPVARRLNSRQRNLNSDYTGNQN